MDDFKFLCYAIKQDKRGSERAVWDNSMTEIIFDYYASRILFGYYEAGDRLPSIGYIGKQFQVSAVTVRAALAKLRAEGYIATAERKRATVNCISSSREAAYTHSLLARQAGMEDICAHAGLLFGPIACFYFEQQDAASLKRIRSQIKKMKGRPARQVVLFYSEAMQPLNNALALNLFWEVVRYLRIPYLKEPANFDGEDAPAAKHIDRMLALAEAGAAEQAAEEMQLFSMNVMQAFFRRLKIDKTCPTARPFHFKWQIYRERPQACYTLAADLMDRIDRGVYGQGALLPSCQALAQEYGVSLITMRRTLALLGSFHITETHNGVGTKIISGFKEDPPDFSHWQIRKNLILFLQALQICALTCRNVAVHTLTALEDEDLRTLDGKIQLNLREQLAFMTGATCLQFIGENSPSPFIREVYHQLNQLLLWGRPLHMLFQSRTNEAEYLSVAAGMQEALRDRDVLSFSDQLSASIAASFNICQSIFVELGFCKEELVGTHSFPAVRPSPKDKPEGGDLM